jgi:fluoroquinolone resistance protein
MPSSLAKEEEYLSKTFSGLSEIKQEIPNIEFESCQFQGCDFTESTFRRCRFIGCTFTSCNLSVIKVPQSQFADVVFDECKIVGVDWTKAAWPRCFYAASPKFNRCVIDDSSFFGLRLDAMVIEACRAHEVDFREGRFCRAVFAYTDFANSLFGKSNLAGADFSGAVNYDIDISNNDISRAKFSRFEAVRLLNSLDIELVD